MWPQSSSLEQQPEQRISSFQRRPPLREAHTLHLLRRDVPAAEPVDGGGGGSIMSEGPNSPVRLPKLLYVMIQRPLWGRTARAHFSTQHGHARMQEPFVPNKHPEGRSRTAAGSCHGLAARVLVVLGWLVNLETKWGPGPFKRPTVKLY